MSNDRSKLAGVALITGAVMFFVFWIFPATESVNDLNVPWPLQVAFHGAQIISLVTGLILVFWLSDAGWARYLWAIGVGAAVVGTPTSLQVFAGGILLMGIAASNVRGLRTAGAALVPGAVLWIILFARGAIIGNESAPRLTEMDQILATSGLILIVTGLILVGRAILRSPQTGLSVSAWPFSDGPRTRSQSTPATATAPTPTNQTGDS